MSYSVIRTVKPCEPETLKTAKCIIMHQGEVFAIAYGNKPFNLYVCLQDITFDTFYGFAYRKARTCGAQAAFNAALERYFVSFVDYPSYANVSGYTFRFSPSERKHTTYDVQCIFYHQMFEDGRYK